MNSNSPPDKNRPCCRRSKKFADARRIFKLSRRESEVAFLVARGNGRKEISQKLKLTLNTISTYLKSLHAKAGVNTHFELHCKFWNFLPKRD